MSPDVAAVPETGVGPAAVKDAQVAYHDWEACHYDDKWSISFDERCIKYAYGRFAKAVPGAPRRRRGRLQGPAPRFGDVLEVGCGTGFFLLNLAQSGVVGRAHCTDISPGMVAECVENGGRLGIAVRGRVADVEALPYPDASFDLVLAHAVVHHLPDLPAAFAELRRVLRPGGRLVIAGEPTLWGDRVAGQVKRAARITVKLAALAWGARRVLDGGVALLTRPGGPAALEAEVDLHCFPPARLEALARDAGFAGVRTTTEELTANWLGWWTRTVEGMLRPELVSDRYRLAVYRTWRLLYGFDEVVARRVVPKGLFYNCVLTAHAPGPDGA